MGDYDDFDDFDQRRPRQREGQTSAGLIAFIFSMVSIGLLAIVGVLWFFLSQEEQLQQPNAEAHRWLMIWFLFLNMLSFVAALLAIILAARGLSPTNYLHRGYSLIALILGVVEIMLTIGVGSFTFCCGLVCGF